MVDTAVDFHHQRCIALYISLQHVQSDANGVLMLGLCPRLTRPFQQGVDQQVRVTSSPWTAYQG